MKRHFEYTYTRFNSHFIKYKMRFARAILPQHLFILVNKYLTLYFQKKSVNVLLKKQ